MGREAIASYIAVAVHNLDSLSHRDFEHPALKKAFTVLDQDLPIILADQGILVCYIYIIIKIYKYINKYIKYINQ